MDVSVGVLFGIITMIGWGVADFLVAIAVRRIKVFKTVLWSQGISVLLFLVAFLFLFNSPLSLPARIIIIILFASFLGTVSYLAYYKGLQVGKVSVISPIASCWAVITVILGLVLLKESLTSAQSIGVTLAIIGAVLVSFRLRDLLGLRLKNLSKGINYAVIAMVAWGVYFIPMKMLIPELGWFLPIFFIKVVSIFYLLAYAGLMREDVSFPKNAFILVFFVGVLETIAFLSFGIGINSEYVSIVAPVSAAFPMITVLLAKVFFKEVLDINQKIGVISVLTGLVLLSM